MPKPQSTPPRPRWPTHDSRYEIVQTDDGSLTLLSVEDQETFHSESGAYSESAHVFVQNSGLLEWAKRSDEVSVLEIGFGTGLNFLLSANAAMTHGSRLQYTAYDRRWLRATLIESLHYGRYLDRPDFYRHWLDWLNEADVDLRAVNDYRFRSEIHLRVQLMDVATTQLLPSSKVDAVFLDAFSPATNPDLWETPFLAALASQLKIGGTITTYCVKSRVQTRLKDLGLAVTTLRGPVGGKREVLLAKRV